MSGKNIEATATCVHCGKVYTYNPVTSRRRKYCSLDCLRKAEMNRKTSRRSREMVSEYNHKGYMSKHIVSLYDGRCAICGWVAAEAVISTSRGLQFARGNEIHHIVPVREGGKANYENLILLCPNHHKQADMGIIDRETLKRYLKKPKTEEELRKMQFDSTDRVGKAIFGE